MHLFWLHACDVGGEVGKRPLFLKVARLKVARLYALPWSELSGANCSDAGCFGVCMIGL